MIANGDLRNLHSNLAEREEKEYRNGEKRGKFDRSFRRKSRETRSSSPV